jgi:hypothetical protein
MGVRFEAKEYFDDLVVKFELLKVAELSLSKTSLDPFPDPLCDMA